MCIVVSVVAIMITMMTIIVATPVVHAATTHAARVPCVDKIRGPPFALCPISLLTLSLLTLLDSNFPGNLLWAWEFHPFK